MAALSAPLVHAVLYLWFRDFLFKPLRTMSYARSSNFQFYLADFYILLIQYMMVGGVIVLMQPPAKGLSGFSPDNPPLDPPYLLTVIGLFNAVPTAWWLVMTRDLSAAGIERSGARLRFLFIALPLTWLVTIPFAAVFLGMMDHDRIIFSSQTVSWVNRISIPAFIVSSIGIRVLCHYTAKSAGK